MGVVRDGGGSEWQGGAAVDAVPECFSGGASAAHQCRADIPRRCRGLTEDVTARAVGMAAMRAYFVARGGLIRKMWSVARVNDVYSHL